MSYKFIFMAILISWAQPGLAQVSNDNIENLIEIKVDAVPLQSNTSNCTLQEKCLNKDLTNKCLIYHNDQWFNFNTIDSGSYFLNIRNQNCRDVKGIQLLVLEGEPCEPETYKLVKCISLGTQDDIYVTLENLASNHHYIINVDGYLNDFCHFEIDVSRRLPEFAIIPANEIYFNTSEIKADSVHINWKIHEEDGHNIIEFYVLKRHEKDKRFNKTKVIPMKKYVTGVYSNYYSFSDTLQRKGTYYFKIVAVNANGDKHELFELSELFSPNNSPYISVPLKCKKHSELLLLLYDSDSGILLEKITVPLIKNQKYYTFNISLYLSQGYRNFKVLTIDKQNKKQEFLIQKSF